MMLGRRQPLQVGQVAHEIDLLHRPRVLDGIPIHLVERRVAHGAQRQVESGIEEHLSSHWQESQDAGFSREQETASAGLVSDTEALAMRVAARERR
jgi:hypothetical protein